MNTNATATKGLAELNNHTLDEQKVVRDGTYGDAQGLSEEDESKIHEDAKLANNEPKELERSLAVHAVPQQPLGPQVPVVRWERFLPLRSLKVLLVENDDSTRQVVSALLRNCSYEVTAVANGLEAWKILVDLSHPIDLVLMEVVMPGFSGMELLYKIMSHKTCKNIPVIMMSSSDSMDIVFKCLSKGAVDFLVKPIRKNELKNLWQHVWRKCHSSSSSASGSESGTRTQKCVKSRSTDESDNYTVSNEEDDASTDLNIRDGSDDGSGTQSSWTKRAVEVESPQRLSPWSQLADPPDSTCALVIHSRQEAFSDNCLDTTSTGECNRKDDKLDGVLGKDSEALVLSDREIVAAELRKKVDRMVAHRAGCVSTKVPNDFPKMNITGNSIHMTEEIPSLDLRLKSPTDVPETETSSQERNVLRHSNLSAFSRYNASTVNQVHGGNINVKASVTESVQNKHYCDTNATANLGSNESTNNNDLGSTTNNTFGKGTASSEKAMMPFHPVQDSHISSLHSVVLNKDEATKVTAVLKQTQNKQPQIQVQHHHHHYHHHHHHVHNSQQQEKDLLSSEDVVTTTVVKHSGPPGESSSPVEGNAANYILSGTVSGSNNGCNGRKSSNVFVITGNNGASGGDESANGVDQNRSAPGGDGSANGGRNGVDQSRSMEREAALNKFRQKRKDRCFEKKVRYHSRKRIAEERPRVRGQFARQVSCDNKSKDEDS